MEMHQIRYFLAAARDFFGLWPDRVLLYFNLRENTPKGQTRWDQQARAWTWTGLAVVLSAAGLVWFKEAGIGVVIGLALWCCCAGPLAGP